MNKPGNLLDIVKEGSEEAYKSLFHNYYSDLVYYAVSIIHDTSLAEDLVQDFFVDFWTKKRYNSVNSNLSSFLFRSVRNNCLNYIRDVERRNKHLSDYTLESNIVVGHIEVAEEKEILYKAINQLSPKCKQIFILCCVHGYKYQEVADDLNISINTVRTQMSRAFKSLRKTLSPNSFSSLLFAFIKMGDSFC